MIASQGSHVGENNYVSNLYGNKEKKGECVVIRRGGLVM
jgi:hypothetical protein